MTHDPPSPVSARRCWRRLRLRCRSPAATGSTSAPPAARRSSSRRRARTYAEEARFRARSSTSFRSQSPICRSSRPAISRTSRQEQLDQIYARLTAGPIPDGPFDGDLVLPEGEERRPPARRDRRRPARASRSSSSCTGSRISARTLWKGKVFYRNERVLRNRIEDLALAQARSSKAIPRRFRRSRSAARTSGCCFRRSSTAARACSTAGASRSSSTTSSPTRLPGYRQRPDFLAGRNGLAGARRDPHGAARLLPRPRLRRQGLPAQLHPLQQGRSPKRDGPAFPQDGHGEGGLLDRARRRARQIAAK